MKYRASKQFKRRVVIFFPFSNGNPRLCLRKHRLWSIKRSENHFYARSTYSWCRRRPEPSQMDPFSGNGLSRGVVSAPSTHPKRRRHFPIQNRKSKQEQRSCAMAIAFPSSIPLYLRPIPNPNLTLRRLTSSEHDSIFLRSIASLSISFSSSQVK